MEKQAMREQIAAKDGFIAALDQSGGSTPKALKAYGVDEAQWSTEDEMFGLIHEMRSRIVKSPAFTGDHVIGAILFERTMDGEIEGKPSAQYIWEDRGVVPFLKVDKGLDEPEHGVRLMKPNPGLGALLERAGEHGVFGTKMRSVIDAADADGVKANVGQQFDTGHQILEAGLVPIIEPEVTITIDDKREAEDLLLRAIHDRLDGVPDGEQVMLKLTLPEADNLYKPLVDHPKVLRVVALSGGYSREEANARLSRQSGMIASFSRALTQGLTAQHSDEDFDTALGEAIISISKASRAG